MEYPITPHTEALELDLDNDDLGPIPMSAGSLDSDDYICLWDHCFKTYDDPEQLYMHMTNDHVGRKSTNNLCLTCHWEKCDYTTAKRDHITSHLRVHVPLKPFACEVCKIHS
ncbi:hypothetical protein BC936DRAFT_145708 [Jimgerdemannia flammicorona]|uniref:C2H2-type domain-containing protein n=1 Tax=Jimgerdemannia flammicorona TaxID=994334 RepID=A0A433D9H2_9FUNG|nr:hypothetical protein BC936DRAFT_145708 [Jimgerdemannia flammicorona]